MRASRWVLLAVILAIVLVVTAKQVVMNRPAEQESAADNAAPAAEPTPEVPAPVGTNEQAAAGSSSEVKPPATGAASRDSAGSDRGTEAAPAQGEGASAPSQPAETKPPSEKDHVGPLPGSKLAEALKNGQPTMADFGRGWCKPCQMMEPLLKQAAQDYAGKANIVFVDLDDYPELGRRHRIGMMPTQVFFDAHGKEVGRHMGYMGSQQIEGGLAELGVEK